MNETRETIDRLMNEKDQCERRLENAAKLIDLLGDEGKRWADEVKLLEAQKEFFLGNVFIASSSLSYLGPFTGDYREQLVQEWSSRC